MKILTQLSLFDDTQNENLGDLERLQKVLASLPDTRLIEKLPDVFVCLSFAENGFADALP